MIFLFRVVGIQVRSANCFCFQAEYGIGYLVRSRGLGDVYKRQVEAAVGPDALGQVFAPEAPALDEPALRAHHLRAAHVGLDVVADHGNAVGRQPQVGQHLSLIHI